MTMAHNSGFAKEALLNFVARIERLTEEKQVLVEDIKEAFGEAKAAGFDTKVMRQAIRLRKIPTTDRMEMEAMLDLYMSALDGAEADERAQSERDAG
jgi:uncharacterized protein (UPF0335 family)